jgi:hypothetical protein
MMTPSVTAGGESIGGEESGLPGESEQDMVYYPREDTTYPEAQVERARQDLAQRLDTSPEGVEVVSVEAVTWPDASLGGASQVLTPGFRIVLAWEGRDYAYHIALTEDSQDLPLFAGEPHPPGAGETMIVQSPIPTPQATKAPPPTPAVAEAPPGPDTDGLPRRRQAGVIYYPREDTTYPEAQVEQAQQDLAQRLSTSPEDIEVVSVEAVTWPDASLGGAREGGAIQVLTPGFRIVLGFAGEEYAYHTGLTDDPRDVLFHGIITD